MPLGNYMADTDEGRNVIFVAMPGVVHGEHAKWRDVAQIKKYLYEPCVRPWSPRRAALWAWRSRYLFWIAAPLEQDQVAKILRREPGGGCGNEGLDVLLNCDDGDCRGRPA